MVVTKIETLSWSCNEMKDLLENKEHPKGHAGPKAEH